MILEGNFAQEGNQRESQNKRGNQGRDHRVSHRRKNLPFVALHGKNRQVRHDDDDHCKHSRSTNLNHRLMYRSRTRPMVIKLTCLTQSPEYILNNDHRPVDNNPEVHRPQRQ